MTTYVINPITNELESAQPRQRVADKFKLEDLLTPGPLRDELKGDFDPTQETYEEYLRRINLRYGGRVNFQTGSERGTQEYIQNIIKKSRDALPKSKRNYLTTAEFAKLIGFESTRPSRLTEVLKSGVDYSKNISEAIKKFADPILSPFKFGRGQYFFKPVKGEALEIIKTAVEGGGPEKQTVSNVKLFTEGRGKTLLNNSLKENKLPSFKTIQNIKNLTPSRIVTALTWVAEASKNKIAGLDFIPINKNKGNKIFKLMMDESDGFYNQYATQVYKNALKDISKQLRQPQNTFYNLKERIRTWAKKKGFPMYSTKSPTGFNVDEILGVKVSSRFKLGPYSVFSRLVDGYLNQRPLARFQSYMAKEIEKLKSAIKKHGANSNQANKIVKNFTKQKTYINLRDDLDARGAKNIKLPELTLKSPDKVFGRLRLEELENSGLDFKKFYDKNKFGFSNLEGATTQKELLEKIKKGELKTKGPTLSSFAGSINLNFLPTEVTTTLAKAGGAFAKLLKGAGAASIPLDAITLSEQARKGLTGFDLANTTALRVAEQTLNAPREIASIFGKEDLYEPFTFGSKYSKKVESSIPMDVRKENLRKLEFNKSRPIVDDMEIAPSKEELEEQYKNFNPEIDVSNLEPENLNITNQDDQTSISLAQGGRVGFQDGTPPVIPGNEPDYSELQVMMDNPNEYNTFPKGTFAEELDKAVYGTDDEKTLMQRFNQMFLDPRAYPYYLNKAISGAANIPEFAFRTVPALATLGSETVADLVADKYPEGKLQRFGERISPKITEAAKEKVGLTSLIEEGEKNSQFPSTQEYVGDSLQILAEFPGPITPFVFFRAAPKILSQIQNLGLSATAIEKLNKKLEQQLSTPNQSRRDFLITTGAGGAVALLKFLGLDKLIGTGTKVAEKAVVKSGGTPQYFFDFVNLIKRKGKDVSDKQAVVERQKVIEYKDYTLTDTDGYVTIRKTDEDMGRDEMMEYKPPEGVVDETTGKSTEVPAQYEEVTAKPDPNDPGNFDTDLGFDSIDEVLEELAKDGKKYTTKELEEMGFNVGTKEGVDVFLQNNPNYKFKTEKAGGGIIKLAGDNSGPPPKSGPTPHGLPYLAKNVTPIKERK